MSCAYEEELTAYMDGELPGPRAREVALHADSCGTCQKTLTLLRRTVAQLQTLPAFEPSAQMRRAVLNRIGEAPSFWERARELLRPAVLMPAMGVATAALVAGVVDLRGRRKDAGPDMGQMELAANLELVQDYDVLGLKNLEDVEVVQHLQELEAEP